MAAGDKPSTMFFEKIHFRNISSYNGGGGSHGSGGDTAAGATPKTPPGAPADAL